VLWPVSDSGTTIIAAEMTGRCCHAIELNPAYVDYGHGRRNSRLRDTRGRILADKTAGLTDPDEAPEAPAIPVSEPGDVWVLGLPLLARGHVCVEGESGKTRARPLFERHGTVNASRI
jgi:hypothetical protein